MLPVRTFGISERGVLDHRELGVGLFGDSDSKYPWYMNNNEARPRERSDRQAYL